MAQPNRDRSIVVRHIELSEFQMDVSRHLAELRVGERLTVEDNGRALAEVRAVPPAAVRPRIPGLLKGKLFVPDNFDDELPADILDAMEGRLD